MEQRNFLRVLPNRLYNTLVQYCWIILLGLGFLPTAFAFGFNQNNENYFIDKELDSRQILQEAAQQQSGTDAFHLFSHGRPGELLLNGQWMDAREIVQFLSHSSFIPEVNSGQAIHYSSLNIYGCNFAKGKKGRQAVTYLEKELGIAIAASDDITGKDGDWELEAGNSKTNQLSLNDYCYNLQTTVASDDFSSGNFSGGTGWSGNWTTSGSPSVVSGRVFSNGGSDRSITRTVDLSSYPSSSYTVEWTMDWECDDSSSGFESGDDTFFEVSYGGGSFSTLQTVVAPCGSGQTNPGSVTLALTGGDANTQIRVSTSNDSASEDMYFDNVVITAVDQCDAAASGNTDTDGDNVSDICDLDDDNDGILDSDEGLVSCTGPLTTVASDGRILTAGGSGTQNVDLSSIDATIGNQVTVDNVQARGDIDAGTDEYFTIVINGGSTSSQFTLPEGAATCEATVLNVSPAFSETVTIIDIGGGTPGISIFTQLGSGVGVFCDGNTFALEYTVDIVCVTATEDTDMDGILDHLDLDSDGDGCSDANESGHAQTVQVDSTIAGPYGANGLADAVETSAESGTINYTISETTPGTYDFQNAAIQSGCDADVSLTKTADNSTINVGDTVTFTLKINNAGPSSATGVIVVDTLDANLTYISSNGDGTYVPGTNLWTVPTVADGDSVTINILATVDAAGAIINKAEVYAATLNDPNSTPNNNNPAEDDQSSITITGVEADLSMVKTVDNAAPNVGDNVVFTLTISNAGTDDATNVSVSDVLSAGLSHVSDDGGGAYNSGTGVWTVGGVSVGVPQSLQITATVTSSGSIQNIATIIANGLFDPDATNNQDTVTLTVPEADISVTKSVSQNVSEVDSSMVYTIIVVNAGPDAATGVVVTDTLPAELTYVNDDKGATESGGTVTWNVGTITLGSSDTINITVIANAGGIPINTAQIAASPVYDPIAANNTHDTCVSVIVNFVSGDSYDLNAPTGLTNYQWYRNGVVIGGATFQTYTVTSVINSSADTISYTADNIATGCSYEQDCPAIFKISNQPPVADNDTTSTNEDIPVSLDILADDSDPDGILSGDSVTIITPPLYGGIVDNMDSTLTYTPNSDVSGLDSLQYEICDSGVPSMCDTAWVFITVNPVNDPPVADNDTTTTNEDTPVTLNTLLDDYDIDGSLIGDSIRVLITAPNGTVSGVGDSILTYTPDANFFGIDSLQYEVCDTSALGSQCDTAWVFITVNPVNDPPVITEVPQTTPEETPITFCPTLTDIDPGDVLTMSICGLAQNGTGILSQMDTCITYTPAMDFTGQDTICIQVCDAGGLCDSVVVPITVTPLNDPPVADNDTTSTNEDTPVTLNILLDDYDIDGSLIGDSIRVLITAPNGTVSGVGDSILTYTPDANFFGIDSLQYEVCDTSSLGSQCDTAWVFITVNPVNDPPVITEVPQTTPEETPITFCPTMTDVDLGDVLTMSICGLAQNGTGILSQMDTCITYTPAMDFTGQDTICIQVCDAGGLCDSVVVPITVTPLNDPPVADNDTTTTNEDMPVTLNILLDDYDIDGSLIGDSIRVLITAPNGTISGVGDSILTYTPDANFFGLDSLQYEVCDTSSMGSLCDTAWVFITVNPVNDPPVITEVPQTTPEETPITFCPTMTDIDLGDVLTMSICGLAQNGTGILSQMDTCITYTPAMDFTGQDTICVQVCDAGGLCDSVVVPITVTPLNDPPVADNDTTTTNEDTPVTLNILLDDYDIDGSLIGDSIRVLITAPNGTVSGVGDSILTYTPDANFFGIDSLQYEVCDTSFLGSHCDTAWVFITVNPVNDPPVITEVPQTTPEETPITFCPTMTDIDLGDVLTMSICGLAQNGTGILSQMDTCITYTPAMDFTGQDTICVQVCDAGGLCDSVVVPITVTPLNDPPVANNDTTTTNEDTPVTLNILLDDYDIDGSLIGDSIRVLITAPNGTVSGVGDSILTYTPDANFFGIDSLQYEVCDTSALGSQCDTAWVFITVNPVNDPPVITEVPQTTPEETPITFCPTMTDIDLGDVLTMSICGLAQNGTGILSQMDTCITYTPAMDFTGQDTICVQVCDAGGLCDSVVVPITVTPLNDPPVADNDTTTTNEDTPVTLNILLDDYDIDGSLIGDSIRVLITAPNGTVTGVGDSILTYTPDANFFGIDSLQYEVCDTSSLGSQCDTAWVFITVNPVNDPPVITEVPQTTPEETPITFCPTMTDVDLGDVLTMSICGLAQNGTGILSQMDTCITYTPAMDFTGQDTICVQVCDVGGLCDSVVVPITVTPLNDPPVADNDTTTTNEDTPVTLNILLDDYDIDGSLIGDSIRVLITAPNGTVSGVGDSILTYTPDANFFGIDSLQYEVCDTSSLGSQCDTAWVFITVNPVNDPPVITEVPQTTPEETPITFCPTMTDVDLGDVLTMSICGLAQNGTGILSQMDTCITYTPAMDFTGQDTICVQVCDVGGLCDSVVVPITVTPLNDPPVADNDTTTTNEDTPVTLNILLDDYDIDGSLIGDSIRVLITAPNGTVSGVGDSILTYTPDANFFGIDSLQYEVCDTSSLGSQCDTAWVFITVNPVNDPPVITEVPQTTPEETPITFCPTMTDIDLGDVLTMSICGLAQNGTGILSQMDTCITYTPAMDFTGQDTICVQVCDAGGLCDSVVVPITVTPLNDPPVADNDTTSTNEDTPVTLNILLDDYDIDGSLIGDSIRVLITAPNGTVSGVGDSILTYTSDANFFGIDSLQYEVCDTSSLGSQCDTAWVFITVNPVNDPPVITEVPQTTPEETPITFCPTMTDIDLGDVLTMSICGLAQNGTGILSQMDTCITYTPAMDFTGQDTICVQVCDAGGLCDSVVVPITVTPLNDPPVANNDSTTTNEDTPVTLNILLDDYDIDGSLIGDSIRVLITAPNGTVSGVGDSILTYTPDANFFGIDSLQYEVCDTSSLGSRCDTAWVFITVNPVNDPPVITEVPQTTPEETPITFCPTMTDIDLGDVLTMSICGLAQNGTGILSQMDTCITYTPAMDFTGQDTICVQVCDVGGLCDSVVVPITVTPLNDPPVADNDTTTTNEDTPVTLNILLDDYDIDGSLIGDSIRVLITAPNGTVSGVGDSILTYTPDANFFGLDSLQYEVCDTSSMGSLCDTAWVFITVNPVNDPPVITEVPQTTPEETPITFCPTMTDIDLGDVLTMSICGLAQNGTGILSQMDTCITYTPAMDFTGQDTICVQVCDAGGLCDSVVVPITVTPLNDPPVADNDTTTTNEDTPVTLNILLDDYDIDGSLIGDSIRVLITAPNGTVSGVGDSILTYTPDANFFGLDSLQYEVCDTSALGSQCDTAWVFITVNPVNDPPVITEVPQTTPEETPITFCPTMRDIDPGDVLTMNICGLAQNGTGILSQMDTCITYTPAMDFTGQDTICVQVCDVGGLCDSVVVPITVTPLNDPPVADNDTTTTNEDTPVTLNILLDDYDIDGSLIGDSIRVLITAPNGTVSGVGDSILTYTPDANFFGIDSLQYEVCDTSSLGSQCDTAWVFITVNPVNDPPVITEVPQTTPEETPITFCPTMTDVDLGDVLTMSICGLAQNGTGILSQMDTCITYTPAMDFTGQDTICVQVCDAGGLCDSVVVPITVTPLNDPPVADNDTTSTNEDIPVTLNILLDDYDIDGSLIGDSIRVLITAPNGTVTGVGDSILTYTPDANFFGIDSLQYEVCDTSSLGSQCDTAWVFITVNPVNDPPVITEVPQTTPEETPITFCPTMTDIDLGDVLTMSICGLAQNGTGILSQMDTCITYTPSMNFTGQDTICVQVCDAGGLCDSVVVPITVTPLNDPPVADNDTTSTNEDTPVTLNILLDDYDIDGNLHGDSIRVLLTAPNGTISGVGDSILTYTPDGNFFGLDSLQYEVCDTSAMGSLCDTAWVFITVNPVNDPPVAVDSMVTIPEDSMITVCPMFTDVDGINDSISEISCGPAAGVGIISMNDNCVTYTPTMNYNGPDTICFVVCDAGGLCDTASIFITVNPVNDPPVATDDGTSTPEDTPVTVNVVANDDDPLDPLGNIDPTTVDTIPDKSPVNGSITIDPVTGEITYTPNMGYNGLDSLEYVVCDDGNPLPALCDTAKVIINVGPVNNPPIAVLDRDTTDEDTPVYVDVLVNDSDPDGDDLTTLEIITVPMDGMASIANLDSILYTPNANFTGNDTLTYRVCDAGGLCDTAMVIIVVRSTCVTISTSVFLEGPWDGSNMYTKLNQLGYLPGQDPITFFGTESAAGQPYYITPWNYMGIEGDTMDYYLTGIPKANYAATVVDWVFVSLRTGTESETTVCERAALLHSDGHIEFFEENLCCGINPDSLYYLVIEHRNHLIVMSHQRVAVNNDTIAYDFRTQQSYINLLGFGQKQISPGVFVMYAGNGQQMATGSSDTDINVGDKGTWLNENGDHSSYYFQDFDLNGDTNVQDKNLWLENNGKFSDVPRN